MALDENRRALRVEAGREEHRRDVQRPVAECGRIMGDGDRVKVDDAEEALATLLCLGVLAEAPAEVSDVGVAARLDAAEDPHWTHKSILSSMASVERLAIVGTGLIGASVGLAARSAGVGDVRGWDVDPAALATAVEREALAGADSLGAAVSGAELVIVAAPVAALPGQVAAVLDETSDGTTVSDVGSTKTP